MQNSITFKMQDGELLGTYQGKACRYAYHPQLVAEMNRLKAADRKANRYFVYWNATCRAAQSTLEGAMKYMSDERVLVVFE